MIVSVAVDFLILEEFFPSYNFPIDLEMQVSKFGCVREGLSEIPASLPKRAHPFLIK